MASDSHNPQYDDDEALCQYVFGNYFHLLTFDERVAEKLRQARLKAEHGGGKPARMLESRLATESPDAHALLEQGSDGFRISVALRVLAEHATENEINLCAACNRVVRTPQAKQCLWCGHDWH
ncbi:hypothetical protein [Posidoniimonas corsicana]|uniref:hypothetical protein n=1 Tax=Posidoniimonas corsicana TaxID=1938618 RepID=UPI0011B623AD|nr:hypothetical protein [Posidoniimonas corsicana]